MNNVGQTVVDTIVPIASTDIYPTHLEQYGFGGIRTVTTHAAMLAILPTYRVSGMRVTVNADETRGGIPFSYSLNSDLVTWSPEGDNIGTSLGPLLPFLETVTTQNNLANSGAGYDPSVNGTAVGNGVTDDSAALNAANVAATGKLIWINKPYKFLSNVTLNNVVMGPSGSFIGPSSIGTTPPTLTISFAQDPGVRQIFNVSTSTTTGLGAGTTLLSATALISLLGNLARPDWWGNIWGSVDIACRSFSTTAGGTVQLAKKSYLPQGHFYGVSPSNGFGMDVPNIIIQGVCAPQYALDFKSYVPGSGSIIQGQFLSYANNLKLSEFGCDSGFTTSSVFFPSGGQNGIINTYLNDAQKAANTLKQGLRLNNLKGLCLNPSDPVHAMIAAEGYTDVTATGSLEGAYGIHGVVFKCSQVMAEDIRAYLNNTEGFILKTDTQSTAVALSIEVSKVYSYANGPSGWTPYILPNNTANVGVLLNPNSGSTDKCKIGMIDTAGHNFGVSWDGVATVTRMQIGMVTTDSNGSGGFYWNCSMPQNTIGEAILANAPIGIVSANTLATDAPIIDVLRTINVPLGMDLRGNGSVVVGTYSPQNATSAMKFSAASRPIFGTIIAINVTQTFDPSGQVPALNANWANVAGTGNPLFTVDYSGAGVVISGLVRPTSTTNVVGQLPFALKPPANARFMVQGYNGTSQVSVSLIIDNTGLITVNEVSGGVANVTSWLSFSGVAYKL